MPWTRRPMTLVGLLLALLATAAAPVAAATADSHGGARARAARPNIVLVMTDDQSTDLVPYMPQVLRMQREGATFSRYFVTDSLCCPSRASMLTGRYPHDTGVLNNTAPLGGFDSFLFHGDERHTYATSLHAAGYRTAYLGKYLNGYRPRSRHVPRGWSTWVGFGNAYSGFDYTMDINGRIARRGTDPEYYVTDVLARRSVRFIDQAAKAKVKRPFLLAIAPFAPHHPYT